MHLVFHHHHHHHLFALTTRSTQTLSHQPFLSSLTPDRSSKLHPVAAQSRCMEVYASRPTLVCPCVGVFKRTSLMSLFLLLQQLPACLFVLHVYFARWEVGGCTATVLLGFAFRISSCQYPAFLCNFHLAFFSVLFLYAFLLVSMWCIRIVAWTQQNLEGIPFYLIRQIIFPYDR